MTTVAATDRISVALIPKGAASLAALCDRTGLSKTDLVNRAVTAYEFLDAQLRAGREVTVCDPGTGEKKSVLFL